MENYLRGGVANKRNSNIELLKVFAIIMIVLSHAIPKAGLAEFPHQGIIDISMATRNIQQIVAVIFAYLGQIGNAVFIVCSAWFLVDDNTFKLSKAISIILDCFVISVLMLGLFLMLGYEISTKMIIRQFMPTILGTNWFVTTYLLLYAIHPYLNKVLHGTNQKEHFCINLALFVFYCIGAMLKDSLLYFNKLLGFVVLYFFVAYMKKYMKWYTGSKKANVVTLALGITILALMVLLTNYLGLYVPFLRNKVTMWCKFWNPAIIALAISAFNLASGKVFVNKTINYISSLSLLVLCFHANPFMLLYFRYDFFSYIFVNFSYESFVAWMLLFATCLMIFGFLMSLVYKNTIQRVTSKLGRELGNNCKRSLSMIFEKFNNVR